MELILLVATLGVVGVLALRFGYDSRETAFSKEEELAGFGLTPPDQPGKLTTQHEERGFTTEASSQASVGVGSTSRAHAGIAPYD